MKKKYSLPAVLGAVLLLVLYLVFAPGGEETGPTQAPAPTAAAVQRPVETPDDKGNQESTADLLDQDGTYSSKEDVALYISQYGELPGNYITKQEARDLGWTSGSLEPYAPGKSIGGDYFGNYEGNLPSAPGREWTECDIDTTGASSRGSKRIVYSNDGLIFYTDDHYETFTLLYGTVD